MANLVYSLLIEEGNFTCLSNQITILQMDHFLLLGFRFSKIYLIKIQLILSLENNFFAPCSALQASSSIPQQSSGHPLFYNCLQRPCPRNWDWSNLAPWACSGSDNAIDLWITFWVILSFFEGWSMLATCLYFVPFWFLCSHLTVFLLV